MKTISVVKDKIDGKPFALLVTSPNGDMRAFGAHGQGERWATWANSSKFTNEELFNSLDISLFVESPKKANAVDLGELSQLVSPEEALRLSEEFEKKSFLQIVETKSDTPEDIYGEPDDVEDFEPVYSFPVTDVLIASMDVAYKQHAVTYKAKAFKLEQQLSSLTLQVKGMRAIWDTDLQGWRCPEDTLNGGQFTNRLGLGCSMGAVRRLGQFLQSVDDRSQNELNAGIEPRGALYRAGRLTERTADNVRAGRVEKFTKRSERRVRKATDRQLNPSFRNTYNALNPNAPMVARARTAAGLRMSRVGQDIAQRGFIDMSEGGRKARKVKPEITISQELRDKGGVWDENLPIYFNPMAGQLYETGAMTLNPWFGSPKKQNGTPSGEQEKFQFLTQEEMLAGLSRATRPPYTWQDVLDGTGEWADRDMGVRFYPSDWEELHALGLEVNGKYDHMDDTLKNRRKAEKFIRRVSGDNKEFADAWVDYAFEDVLTDDAFNGGSLKPSRRRNLAKTILTFDPLSNTVKQKRKGWAGRILSLDPLADGETRRSRRRVDKKSKKEDKVAGEIANLHDFFKNINADESDAISNIEQNISANVRFYSPSKIGEPTPEWEMFKGLVDQIILDSGFDPGEDVVVSAERGLANGIEGYGLSGNPTAPDRGTYVSLYRHFPSGDLPSPADTSIELSNYRVVTLSDGKTEEQRILREEMSLRIVTGTDGKKHVVSIDMAQYWVDPKRYNSTTVTALDDRMVGPLVGRDDLLEPVTSPYSTGVASHLAMVLDSDGDMLAMEMNGQAPYSGGKDIEHNVVTGKTSTGITGQMSLGRHTDGQFVSPKGREYLDEFINTGNGNWWSNKSKRKNTRPIRRDIRGDQPEIPGIISRWMSGEGRQWARESAAAKRLEQGRMPKPTDNLRIRLAKRIARVGYDIRNEGVPEGMKITIPQSLSELPMISSRAEEATSPRDIWKLYPSNILEQLRFVPTPGIVDQNEWRDNPDNYGRILDLNNALRNIGGFTPYLTDFDNEHQDDLREVYNSALRDLNDPSKPDVPGSPSNLGHAIVREMDDKVYVYDDRQDHKPLVMVIDNVSGSSHIIGEDGQHLLSVVERVDNKGDRLMMLIAGESTREKIIDEPKKSTFTERLTGKFRKRGLKKAPASRQPQRIASRGVQRSKARSGLTYPQTTTGDFLDPNITYAGHVVDGINKNLHTSLDSIRAEWRSHLKIGPNDPISEDAALDYLEDLKKSNPRLAGIRSGSLHNLLVLSEWENSNDFLLVNNLKPSLRNSVIDNVGIPTGVDRKKKRNFTPHKPTQSSSGSLAQSLGIYDQPVATVRTPGWVRPNDIKPQAPGVATRVITGPSLDPGVGNKTLNIVHTPNGYLDNNTGLYVEDLSGLEPSALDVYDRSIIPEVDPSTGRYRAYPELQITVNPAIRPKQYVRITAGVDLSADNPALEITTDPRAVKQITDVIPTFNEAVDATRAAQGGRNEEFPRLVKVDFSDPNGGTLAGLSVDRNYADVIAAAGDSRMDNGFFRPYPMDPTNEANPSRIDTSGGSSRPTVNDNLSLQDVRELGMDPFMPHRRFYTPDGDMFVDNGQTGLGQLHLDAIKSMNAALQLEDVTRAVAEALQNNDTKAIGVLQGWIGPIDQAKLNSLRAQADKQWKTTLETIRGVHSYTANKMEQDLATHMMSPGNRVALLRYVANGNVMEQMEHLLNTHIVHDPDVRDAVTLGERQDLESVAKRLNRQILARRARQASGTSTRQDFGFFDDAPYVLDPHGGLPISNQPNRSPQEIIELVQQHRADGFPNAPEVDPTTGAVIIDEISDEHVDALALMDEAYKEYKAGNRSVAGHPDIVGREFHDTDAMMMGSMWEWGGFNSKPVLLSDKELEEMATNVDSDGNPTHLVIARGVNDSWSRGVQYTAGQLAQESLNGERFIPGQGMSQHGRGEYWSLIPVSWSQMHGTDGTTLGLISQDSIMSAEVLDGLFGQNSSTYEGIWSIVNAIGAPGFPGGVNSRHGTPAVFNIAPNSFAPDPVTGLIDTNGLQSEIDRLTTTDGPMTVEGIVNGGWSVPSSIMSGLFPPSGASPAEQVEYTQYRQKLNAWIEQTLNYVVQIASQRQDISQPGQAGKDAIEHNKKLDRAIHTLTYLAPENWALMMGVDAIITPKGLSSDGLDKRDIIPSQLWKSLIGVNPNNPNTGMGNGNVVRVLNRSGIAQSNHTWNLGSARDALRNWRMPDGQQIPHIRNRDWQ